MPATNEVYHMNADGVLIVDYDRLVVSESFLRSLGSAQRIMQLQKRVKGGSMTTVVTEEMVKAGDAMASDLMDGIMRKSFGTLGGGVELKEWLERPDLVNKDIIQDYLDERIVSVTAIYLAMERARHGHQVPMQSGDTSSTDGT